MKMAGKTRFGGESVDRHRKSSLRRERTSLAMTILLVASAATGDMQSPDVARVVAIVFVESSTWLTNVMQCSSAPSPATTYHDTYR